jgi:integrase/recombinase XerD
MNISAAIEEYLGAKQNSITHSTYAWYDRFLALFDAWCKDGGLDSLSQITPQHVQRFVAASPTRNTHTLHARAQIVKGFLSWCAQDDEMGVKERVVRRVEMPKVEQSEIEIFSDSEILRLFRACNKTQHPHRNSAILHVLLDTGIRAAELCYDGDRPEEETGLRMENVILGRASDSFVRVMGKGRKVRTVGMGQETAMAVRRYLHRERGHADSPFVFLNRSSEPLSVRMLQQLLRHLGELAGVPNCHAHRFRHTYAIAQLMAGTSALVLMQLMGHTTLEATKIYTRALSEIQARKAASSVVDRMKRKERRSQSHS